MGATLKLPIPIALPEDLSGCQIGRFLVHHKLGTGGMGEVYYADDTVLHRPIALKRLAPRYREPDSRRRFLSEAQRASTLNSENIAAVYDVLEQGRELLLILEYAEGVTLRRRLEEVGRFTIDSFLHIASQCVIALTEAEKRNIVHRDLKPENIMLDGNDHVKLLDFGLACRSTTDISTLNTTQTQNATLAGTPGYFAPEVLLQQRIDTRADIFSLGVVFYEMLTGTNPFAAAPLLVSADRTLHSQPSPILAANPQVSEGLERIVFKMLAKAPSDRYANASDLLHDLLEQQKPRPGLERPGIEALKNRHGVAVTLILLIASLLTIPLYRWGYNRVWPPLPTKKHIVVLPFTVESDNVDDKAFSRGLTETLTARLAQLSGRYDLQVVLPGELRGVNIASVAQARSDFGTNLALQGSIHRVGSRIRVVHRLVHTGTQQVLRAGTVTADLGDPFALEDKVVESALRSLELEFGGQQPSLASDRSTTQPAAYDYYLRGRGYLQEYQQPENIQSAIKLFQRALEVDPEFSLAHAGLGESYWYEYQFTHDRDWIARALESCKKSAARGLGHQCLGTIYNGTGKYSEASSEFQKALRADDRNLEIYRGLGFAYEHIGKAVDAEKTYRQALDLRPEYWGGYNWLGVFLYGQHRYDEAIGMFKQVTDLAPDNVRGYNNLCGVYIAVGQYAAATPVCAKSASIRPTQDAYLNLGNSYFYQRRFTEAATAYDKAVRLDERMASAWGNLADALYWQMATRNDSFSDYRKAIALRTEQIKVNPKDALAVSYVALYHAMLREKSEAWTNANRASALAPNDPDVQYNLALIACQLGEQSKAISWLRKALQGGVSVDLARGHPVFDSLRNDRSFRSLIDKEPLNPSI